MIKKHILRTRLTRRSMMKLGLIAGGTTMLALETVEAHKEGDKEGDNGTSASSASAASCSDFTQELFVPKIAQAGRLRNIVTMPPSILPSPDPGNYHLPRFGTRPGGPADPGDGFNNVAHGIAPEFDPSHPSHCTDWNAFETGFSIGNTHEKEYKLITEETTHQFFPGAGVPPTPVFVYRDAFNASDPGRTPGPTFVARYREPIVVRNENHLIKIKPFPDSDPHDVETSIHLHGTHGPAHSDGYPDFYVLAGEARDYFYTNISPRVTDPGTKVAPVCGGPSNFDTTWIPSTLWYHDHGMDVTGFNVTRGLAGFYLVFDQRELDLITGTGSASERVLPPPGRAALESLGFSNPDIQDLLGTNGDNDAGFDFGLALQDQQFELVDGEPRLAYDFMDHNGRIGDVFTVNGTVQPVLDVKQTKYRFRILNASNARIYQLRLSSGDFIVFGADSWLFPRAGVVNNFELAMGQRHDVIIDFSGYSPDTEVCLENIMIQDDGRKGDEVDPDKPTPLLKFKVVSGDAPNVSIEDGTVIRGFKEDFMGSGVDVDPPGQWAPIREVETEGRKREFKFDRSHGAWTVNGDFFNPRRADAVPELGTAETWILENSSGGWWHPIHTHLEGFQIQTLDGKLPPFERRFNSDLVNLHGGEEAKVFIKFRTFTGPFVFHCHNVEHEDMRMMGVHDPQPPDMAGVVKSPLNSVDQINSDVSGVVPTCDELEKGKYILFDVEGDVDRLEGRGVGFPECEFEKD